MKRPTNPDARTSLRHVGGPTRLTGDPGLATILARAFDVGEDDADATRAHVHGFHSYPARLHPTTAARLLSSLSAPKSSVLDPFCGSGTVLVEARLAGLVGRGTDINPLAIRLARLKTRGVPPDERTALVGAIRWCASFAEKRHAAHVPVSRRYPPEDTDLFEPHVLMELDALRDALDRITPDPLREDAELVFSAILTKVSRKRGDTGTQTQARRLPPGFVSRLLVAKAEELARGLESFARHVPHGTPPPDIRADNAAVLGTVPAGAIDLVLSSPPYAATYDYVQHHDVRLRWLGLRADRLATMEVGARRTYLRLHPSEARARWSRELGGSITAIARVLRPGGQAVLVLADSAVGSEALRAPEIVRAEAEQAGLTLVACASQARPHFHTRTRDAFLNAPREEHVLALVKPSTAPPSTASRGEPTPESASDAPRGGEAP